MPHTRILIRAAAVFALALLWAPCARADETIGGACTGTVAAGPQAANGNNVICVSSAWQYPAYQLGVTAAACNATNAGMLQYTAGNIFQGCIPNTWTALSTSTTSVNLGATVSVTNPHIATDATSGFYTAAAATVDVSISGVKVAEWVAAGETVVGAATANSFIPNGSSVPTNGMYLSAANTLDFSTNSAKHLEIGSTGNLNIATSTAALQLGGTTVLTYPTTGTDTTSIAVGPSALASQTATGNKNTAVGNLAAQFVSTGTGETAIGQSALLGITGTKLSGGNNTAVGASALLKAQGAAANDTAVGQSAGSSITTGSTNTILGAQVASTTLTTGANNILIGTDSTTDTATAATAQTVIIGTGAKGGTGDTAVGYQALNASSIVSAGNVAIGYQAMKNVTSTSTLNVAIGYQALFNGGPGNADTAVGYQALYSDAAPVGGGGSNTAVGYQACYSWNSGNGPCTAFGYKACYSATDNACDAFGWQALMNNTTGAWNTAFGDSALTLNVVGSSNTAVGYQALTNNTASTNTAIGYQALLHNTVGSTNVGLGAQALLNSVTGSQNTAIGTTALQGVTSASGNTGLGYNVGATITTGGNNTIIGALVASTTLQTGSYNVLIGTDATTDTPLTTTTSAVAIGTGVRVGTSDVGIGYQALTATTTNNLGSVAVGYQSLGGVTNGVGNTAVGYQAGKAGTAVTTGTNNTFIGFQAQGNSASITNSTALGYTASVLASNTIVLGNGSIGNVRSAGTYTNLSDRRHKKDIANADLGLEFVARLKPVSYRFTNGIETLHYGFIAQDIEEVLPENLQSLIEDTKPDHGLALVSRDNNQERTYNVGYSELLAPVVKSIQQQEDEFAVLRDEADALAATTSTLAATAGRIEAMNRQQATELNGLRQEIAALKAKSGDAAQ